jgi:spermidine synthase
MKPLLEELDFRRTPMGDLMLRRRLDPVLHKEVYEVKLGDEFLMSSLFTEGEVQLSRLGLASLDGPDLDVVVGGLGLGYTAGAVLEHATVGSLLIVEALGEVIDWHRRALVPLGATLSRDPRCRMLHDSFFERALSDTSFDPDQPGRRFHAVLLDIDHSPSHLLHPDHAAFYQPAGLAKLKSHLQPGGSFALWSNDPPDDDFTHRLGAVFEHAAAHIVSFDNPFQNRKSVNTVYVAGVNGKTS